MNRFIKIMTVVVDVISRSALDIRKKKLINLFTLLILILPVQILAQIDTENWSSSDSLTSEQINRFADYSIENAVGRFPGVQINREGNITIRGLGFTSYYVMMDGQRLANTGFGDRSIDLRSFSADMIEELQLSKVLNPKMEADAIAGVINLSVRQNVSDERLLEVTAGGGFNPHYLSHSEPANRLMVKYAERINESFSISLNLNYQKDMNAWDQLEFGYGQFDFGNGLIVVPERIAPGFQIREQSRLGANLVLQYKPTATSSYYLQGMVNSSNGDRKLHQNNWLANESWINPQTTGAQASLLYDFQFVDINNLHVNFLAGGINEFDKLKLNYELGWTQSNIRKNSYHFPFEMSGIDFTVIRNDPHRPQIQPGDQDLSMDDFSLQSINHVVDNHLDTRYSAKVDVEIPFSIGSFQAGTSALFTLKDAFDRGAYSNYNYEYRGVLNLSGFEKTDAGMIDIFDGKYNLPWLIDAGDALSFFEASIPNMRLDRELFYRNSDIWNYQANEHIYAGYGMATFNFGKLSFLGGLRVEYTAAEYTGRNVAFNRFGQYETTSDTSRQNNYVHLFPNAQLLYSFGEKTNLRLAYSRSLSRPDFNMLAPFELTTAQDTSLYRGNPELEPILSDNLDLILEQFYSNTGKISAGLFYKKLSNHFIYYTRQIEMVEGDNIYFNDFFNDGVSTISATENSFQNSGETATIYGFELSWQDQLAFLPGIFKNFSFYGNYTWMQSNYNASKDGEIAFIKQSPHIFNAALMYGKDRFSAQLSYHYSAEFSDKSLNDIRNAVMVNAPSELFEDYFEQGRQNLSATIRYDISERFQIWADAYNLINNDRLEYAGDPDLNPLSIYYRQGFELMMGIKFTL